MRPALWHDVSTTAVRGFPAHSSKSRENPLPADQSAPSLAAAAPSCRSVRFSNRPVGVKRFQTIHRSSVDVSRGLALLFGIGTRALPSWGSRTRWNNLYRGLAIKQTTDPSGHTNSPHPSSREGHHSTARWSSSSSYRIDPARSSCRCARLRVQRNSVPSTQMRCMITANRRASATIASLNRPVGVKRFQTIHRSSVDVSRGLALLFGIGTRALPSWGSRTRWNNLYRGLAIKQTTDPSGHTNSPHPSSREGHHSTARWSSSSSYRIRSCTVLYAAATSRVQRNSVPSTQMRCMITANRRASATIAFFIPRCRAIFIAHALSHDHFVETTSMVCAAS